MGGRALQYRVLGRLEVDLDDGIPAHLPRRARGLVAVLLVFAGESCRRDMLVRALWGDRPPANPAAALQTCLCRARAALGESPRGWWEPDGCLRTLDDGALRAEPAPQDLDLTRFLQLHSAALQLLEHGHLRPAREKLEQALACWRNPPLDDLPDAPAAPEVAARRDCLLEQRRLAWLTLADVLLALGEQERILPDLHERVVADPLDEHAWAQLILGLYQGGRAGEALAFYNQARTELVGTLGAEPGAELKDLRDRVLLQQAVIIPAQLSRAGLTASAPAWAAAQAVG